MNEKTFLENIPVKLNKQQLEAVRAAQGPVLLLAVPGSGKTTVLVTRLGYMIKCLGIRPDQILTLTYTVAATNDMRARFQRFFGQELGNQLVFRTINSICAKVIRQYGQLIGKEPYRLENDEKVLLGLLAGLYQKYQSAYPTESDLKSIKTYITYIKNMMLSEQEIKQLEPEAECQLLQIYQAYCQELKSRRCMDFDDQMVYAYRLLQLEPRLLAQMQGQYPFICVDEAQDTSRIQHAIIALLAARTENLFLVGDEDQSIYGFRAAYPEALLSFEKQHRGAKVLLMEENFRSNAHIVAAADRFIQQNTLRHKKQMRPARPPGSQLKVIDLESSLAQHAYLLKVAQGCKEQTAVLYRDNESAIPLVDLLERHNVSYRIRRGELSFFTHRVVMDIQNIMRFAQNMNDGELFQQIYYKLSTYLTKQQVLEACAVSQAKQIPIFNAVYGYVDIKPHTRRNLKDLERQFRGLVKDKPLHSLNRILYSMGYGDYMERMDLSMAKLMTLKAIASRVEDNYEFLQRMMELEEIIRSKEDEEESLFILSTIHGSKGLEYDTVYLLDVMDGVFPKEIPLDVQRASKEELALYEEERRIFYVGVTRARDNLYLFKSKKDTATFIQQLLADGQPRGGKDERVQKRAVLKPAFSQQEYQAFLQQLSVGSVVNHKKFGAGTIRMLAKDNAVIDFGTEEKAFNLRILFANQLLKL